MWPYLADHGSTARLDSLNLGHVDWAATESGGKLGEVEEHALGGIDRAKLGTRGTANASLSAADGLLERTVLLGMVAVGAERGVARRAARGEGLGEGASRRGRVRLRSVVDGGWRAEKVSSWFTTTSAGTSSL